MRLLIDENVPDSVAVFLRARGHDVSLVREILGQMTPDDFVAWVGNDMSAIVVTIDRDFNRIIRRVPTGGRTALRSAGRISLRCRESQALGRLREFVEEIEREFDRLQSRSDGRLIVEITGSSYRIVR